MSELIQKQNHPSRWKLLTGVSAMALLAYISSPRSAEARDDGHPQLWIELDGEFSQLISDSQPFQPPFLATSPFNAVSQLGYEKAPPTSWNAGGTITFQPTGSDWSIAASLHYGRNGRHLNFSHVTAEGHDVFYGNEYVYAAYQAFQAQTREDHFIVDFKVGRDLGIGVFGRGGQSTISAGIRFAHFNSRTEGGFQSQPTNCASDCPYNKFYASFEAQRKFTGVGPSLSWDASSLLAGNSDDGGISFDWGLNGAVLFGRQKMTEHHQTTKFLVPRYQYPALVYRNVPAPVSRSKSIAVPNLGGFAAMSWRYPNAKVSLGYRADLFFGVMDGGIETRKSEDVGFHGPFAAISIGLGG